MSTYREIKALTRELGGSRVGQRREAGQKLIQMLSLPEVRSRLVLEASPLGGTRGAVQRRTALAEMWRFIIQNAVVAVQTIARGNSKKLNASDIHMPYKLLQCSELPYETNMLYEPPKLSRKVAKLVFTYCYDMLQDEHALGLAEEQLLQMMAYLCHRTEYVAYMRPHMEIYELVQEIEHRITVVDDGNPQIMIQAGQIWENLIITATRELGMGLHLLLPGCVKIVAVWCHNHLQKQKQCREFPHILRGLAVLLESDLEQAVAPLTRYGRQILSLAKRGYATRDKLHRQACNEYFMAHLRVCQTAGKLQGRMPGDLGDLGNASLSIRQVTTILDLLMGQIMKKDKDESGGWPMNDEGMRLQFELTARLLACAQRLYLSAAEWSLLEDPTQTLISLIEEAPSPNDYLSLGREASRADPCPVEVLAKSPFVEGVLRMLYDPTSSSTASSPAISENRPGGTVLDDLRRLSSSSAAESASMAPDNKTIAAALRIITMCAVFFPTGVCWTSNTSDHWQVLPPTDPKDEQDAEYLPISASSTQDLALVIEVVTGILERCGGTSGDDEVQRWVLHCLRALTTSSATLVLLSHRSGNVKESACLESAWRRVWTILHRPDFRYREWTKSCVPGSKGELVLQLLFEMVRRSCLDCIAESNESPAARSSAFVYQQQCELWSLPIYSQTGDNTMHCTPFLLLYAVLSCVGLSEQGNDEIAEWAVAQDLARDSGLAVNRRTRLVFYCMKYVECDKNKPGDRALASACIGALLQGEASMLRGVLFLGSESSKLLNHTLPLNGKKRDLLCALWSIPSFDVKPASSFASQAADISDLANSRVLDMLAEKNAAIRFSDFIPGSQAEKLLKLVFSRFSKFFFPPTVGDDDRDVTLEQIPERASNDTVTDLQHAVIANKVVLTIILTTAGTTPDCELKWFTENVSQLFRSIASGVGVLSEDPDEFLSVFGQTHGLVRAMTGVVAKQLVAEWSETFMEAASLLFDTCDALLEHSSFFVDKAPSSNQRNTETVDDDFLEESDHEATNQHGSSHAHQCDSDVDVPHRRKRRRRSENTSTSRKRIVLDRGPPNQECTFMVASLILGLRPSPNVCELVATKLLGVDKIGEDLPPAVDILGGAVSVTLICTEEAFIYPYAADKISGLPDGGLHQSLVLLICRIITAIRSVALPPCKFHLFGYEACAQLVRMTYSIPDSELSEEEARLVAELILSTQDNTERRSLWLRPQLRDSQLQSAVVAFNTGKNNFHEQFDNEFPRTLVLPSLYDVNGAVRRSASNAVAAALRILPEDKVMESVQKRLPTFFSEAEDERTQYRQWYSDKNLGCGEGYKKLEDQVWEDALASVRFGALSCWSEIAQATSLSQTTESCLFDFIRITSTRPDLEGLCFCMLERIAHVKGHSSVVSLLEECTDGIIARWLRLDNSLLDIPLLLSAPFLMKRLVQSGRAEDFFADSTSQRSAISSDDSQKIRETAASEFLSRHSHVILPQIIFRSVSAFMKTGVTRDYRRRFIEEDYVKEVCSVFADTYDDDIVRTVVRSHTGDILVATAWRMNTTSDDEERVAPEVERLVVGLLGEDAVRRHGETSGHYAVRRLLAVASTSTETTAIHRFLGAANVLARAFHTDLSGIDSVTSLVATMELLIYARSLMMDRLGSEHPEQIWLPMGIVLAVSNQQIREGCIDIPQLQFYFQILANVLVDPKLRAVHFKASCALKSLAETLLGTQDAPTMAGLVIETLHIAFAVLEQNLESFLVHCKSSKSQTDESLRQVLGLRGGYRMEATVPGDTWGWNASSIPVQATTTLLEQVSTVPSEITVTLGACRDLIDLVIRRREIVQISDSDILGVYHASELSSRRYGAYEDLHPAFGLRRQLEASLTKTEMEEERFPVLRIFSRGPDELRRLSFNRQKQSNSGSNVTFFSIEEKYLIDELGQLENYLATLRRQDSTDRSASLSASLLSKLGTLCCSSFPRDVRLAASRCLGEVELSRINMELLSEAGGGSEDWLAKAVKSGTLLRTLQARGVEALVVSLNSSNPKIGLVAVETLRALLSTRIGIECQPHIPNQTTMSLLTPFTSQTHKSFPSQLCLNESEIEGVRSKLSLASGGGEDWCWNENLWKCTSESSASFEHWICCIVPALLTCCYGRARSLSSSGDDARKAFYGLCQRMSSLEPEFATRLFPSIIMDLLVNNNDTSLEAASVDQVLLDTWVGQPGSKVNRDISRCFTALLKNCTDGGELTQFKNRNALELAVDTLDILYQFTQHRFSTSRSHRKNSPKPRSSIKDSGRNSKRSSQETDSSQDADLLKSIQQWDGLRFGTVLRIDGLLVSRACLCASRPASALFYAELYGDSRFGGSTIALEAITLFSAAHQNESLPISRTGDVSGFASSSSEILPGPENGREFLTVLRDCYSELEEKDAREAAEASISDLSILSTERRPFSLFAHAHQAESLPFLGLLDNAAHNRGESRSIGAIADTLENLGLRFTLESYIAGLTNQYQDVLVDLPTGELIEKWFRCRLFSIPWDDRTFDCIQDSAARQGDLPRHIEIPVILDAGDVGFHAVLFDAMTALQSGDYSTSLSHVAKARDLLADTDSLQKAYGFLGDSMQTLMDRARALNDLERIVSSPCALDTVLSRLQRERKQVSTHMHRPDLERCELSNCVKEIALRHLFTVAKRSTASDEARSLDLLLDHMWHSHFSSSGINQYKSAGGVLTRINSILQFVRQTRGLDFVRSSLLQLRLQEAEFLERTNNFTGAIRSAKQTIGLIRSRHDSLSAEDMSLLADALVSCGEWMTKYKVEPSRSILDSYMKPGADLSVSVLERQESSSNAYRASSALLAVSQLASQILETVSARVKSIEWQQAGISLEQRQKEHTDCTELLPKGGKRRKGGTTMSDKEISHLFVYSKRLEREIHQIQQERNEILLSVDSHQKLVLSSIGKALAIAGVGSGRSLSNYVYRMVDIWFAVLEDKNYSDDVDKLVTETIRTIPSFRFVPLSNQLFSRLDAISAAREGQFQERLHGLLIKMCLEHPYHCLVQLVAISNGTKIGDGVNGHGASAFLENTARGERVEAASDLLLRLRRGDNEWVASLVDSYQTVANAYIFLANAPTDNLTRGNTKKIPFSAICKKPAERLDTCFGKRSLSVSYTPCILTKPPLIRPGCDYGNGKEDPIGSELISGFDAHFAVTDGGVHRPKIVVCIGSKGGMFKQLVKGQDEIRQDAVMEQVFGYVNELTARRTSTNSSAQVDPRLNLVTYNVIPLSPASGVLEWVEQSVTLADFVVDTGSNRSGQSAGAHSRYFPGEWAFSRCKERLKAADPNEKREAFDEICAHWSPCFRYFFLERFGHSKDSWYNAKMRYTRSVAVNSVVGHILGIGDRHCGNILIHQGTGEVVHIDFGIVFEQGKTLQLPELVPFRLTRNIVDGMGPMGTEGVFMKAAQSSLGALKDNSSALLTILSSITNDPLYSWCLSPIKARRRQLGDNSQDGDETENNDNGNNNEYTNQPPPGLRGNASRGVDRNQAASHAISRVREKLAGYEDGYGASEQQSIEGQIQLLVNSARDRDNLCHMYVGWAPWL